MELSEYNGWENKFTWLVHLHLSSEQHLMQEMTELLADAPIGYPVGRLVEKWVIDALTSWQMNTSHRERVYDEYLRLLAWDLAGSALAYADWDMLVRLLAGETVTDDNFFTLSLYRSIMNDYHVFKPVGALMNEAPNAYACADAIKGWFEVQINTWIDASTNRRQRNATIWVVVYNLMQSAYKVISWEHVALAFQPEY